MTVGVCGGRGTAGRAAEIGIGNAEEGRSTGEVTLRVNIVEDAVVPEGGLVECRGREHVAPADADIACVVDEVLIAAEGIFFGKAGRAAGRKSERLVVAEAAKQVVRSRERLVQSNIELGFVQDANRLVDIVVARRRKRWAQDRY